MVGPPAVGELSVITTVGGRTTINKIRHTQ